MPTPFEMVDAGGIDVRITNPTKVFFPATGATKMDLADYYLSVAPGVLTGCGDRPTTLYRWPNGVGAPEDAFFQKRVPDKGRPEWLQTALVKYPSGRSAELLVVADAAHLLWMVNMGCIDINPWPVRAGLRGSDLEHPDELRIDLDPLPGIPWSQVLDIALLTREVLEEFGLTGWPKTSGSRGFHIYCRIAPRWTFPEVRRAAVAMAREVERRAPDLATSKWWKEERHGVFLDYNQNAKDRTIAAAYSVRPTPDARVSAPLYWDEVSNCDPAAFTIDTVPGRLKQIGDPWEGIDDDAGSLDPLLELAAEHAAAGFDDTHQSGVVPPPAPGKKVGPTGRRRTTRPLIEIARAATKAEALAGLERWNARHPDVTPHLAPADILVDSMRGKSSTWTRIRVNLHNVPAEARPAQGPLEVDYDPWEGVEMPERPTRGGA